MRLERASGLPFQRQWAFEWMSLRDKLAIRYTDYPYYFDNIADVRAGIRGQYWQRMREVYRSAYLRTLAFAVSEWRLPQKIAQDNCVELVEGIAGLFEVDLDEGPFGCRIFRSGVVRRIQIFRPWLVSSSGFQQKLTCGLYHSMRQ